MSQLGQRILVVDDEPDLLELVRVNLGQAGFAVDTAETGTQALERVRRAAPDLIILDLMLPDLSGTEVCRRVRSDAGLEDIPIIMLTAKSDEVDRVVGLELGADDYVTKPFSPRELTLRARAVLRRRQPSGGGASPVLERSALRLDPERHRCFVGEEEIELTAKEFSLLRELMLRPGRVMTREQILDDVWGTDIAVTTRTIDTHLKRLREKLGAASHLIETVRGVGYRFAE
jgi:two-component system phosphate regulon response regulator PhoB